MVQWRTDPRMNSMIHLVRVDATDGQLSRKFFLARYVQKKPPTLNVDQCALFRKREKPPPSLKNQPPTDCNALIHVMSVHGQSQSWK